MTLDREALSAVRVNGNLAERKAWMTNLESRLTQASGSLNSSRTKLLAAIVDNAEDNYFLSSRALAKRYDVDKATVVRSIQALGYERYAEFAADLRAHFVSRITPYTLMKSAAREKRSIADHVEHSLEMDLNNLQALRANGVPTFGITDTEKTPIARFCDSFWLASIANPSFHGSYVAPIAAMDALFVACAHIQPKRSLALLRRKDQDSKSRWYAPARAEVSSRETREEVPHVKNSYSSGCPM